MDKQFYKECIRTEVEYPKEKKLFIYKFYCRYLRPESNAVYLIRTLQLSECMGGIHKLRAKYCEIKLMRRYGIYVHPNADIGLGFRIVHPMSIAIGNASIGKNFSIYQNCTIGNKKLCDPIRSDFPQIGDNVTMYANSMAIGKINIADNVSIGANSVLLSNAIDAGTYIGSPAKNNS